MVRPARSAKGALKNWVRARPISSLGILRSSMRTLETSIWLMRALPIAFSRSFSETRPLSTSKPYLEGLLERAARCWL